jgi:endonuclease III
MSVHTTWEANIKGYVAIKEWWRWLNKGDELKNLIHSSRVGMQNNRARYIEKFAQDYWQNPDSYLYSLQNGWVSHRDSLAEKTLGLGPAKTSFSIELCYPNSAYIACMDTHLFQVYGLNQTKDLNMYEKIEAHWLDMSRMWNVPPYIARCIFWDKKQNKQDSRYWSYVFECLAG